MNVKYLEGAWHIINKCLVSRLLFSSRECMSVYVCERERKRGGERQSASQVPQINLQINLLFSSRSNGLLTESWP